MYYFFLVADTRIETHSAEEEAMTPDDIWRWITYLLRTVEILNIFVYLPIAVTLKKDFIY